MNGGHGILPRLQGATRHRLESAKCAPCHGKDGKGTSAGAELFEPLGNDPATDVIETTLNGKTGTDMAAYSSVLTGQQIADLYAYMKATFKQGAGSVRLPRRLTTRPSHPDNSDLVHTAARTSSSRPCPVSPAPVAAPARGRSR